MNIHLPNDYQLRERAEDDYKYIVASNEVWSDPLERVDDSYTHNVLYVEEALDLITWPDLDFVKDNTELYISNLPARYYNNGAALYHEDIGAIFLYGKTTAIPRYMTHYITAHEIGHIIQGIYCNSKEDIDRYINLRSISKDGTRWADCWKEVFAEDFRWIFSIESAHQNTWGINMKQPTDKVTDFMLCLVDKRYRG